MKQNYRNNIYLWIALPLLIAAIFWELLSVRRMEPKCDAKKVYSVFEAKEKLADKYITHVLKLINGIKSSENIWRLLDPADYQEDETYLCVLDDDELIFWSSSLIAFPREIISQADSTQLIHLPTGWYYVQSRTDGEYTVNGFILIKREFPYKNRYIESVFPSDFDLPDSYAVRAEFQNGAINIVRPNGEFLFSVEPIKGAGAEENNFPLMLLYFSFIFLVLAQINSWLRHNPKILEVVGFLISIAASALMYLLLDRLRIPNAFYQSELFSPHVFAYSGWLSSLGEYILLSVLMFYVAQSFFNLFRSGPSSGASHNWTTIFAFAFAGFYFTFSVFLFRILILNSNISLQFFTNLQLSLANVGAYFCVSLHALGFVLIALRLRIEFYERSGIKSFFTGLLAAGIAANLILRLFGKDVPWTPYLYYFVIIGLILLTKPDKIRNYKFTFLLIVSIISATYLNLFAYSLETIQKNKAQKLLALNLSSERDPAAEVFLTELSNKFKHDSLVKQFLFPPYEFIGSYLKSNYFTGFWRNYDMQITVCAQHDTLTITDENKKYPCFAFYTDLESKYGVLIPGSSFYFMDWLNGPVTYLGDLDINNPQNGSPIKVFIVLSAKILPEGSGYPELLLDENSLNFDREKGFSYAKYYEGQLVDRVGDYQYEMLIPEVVNTNADFTYFIRNGYLHCAYHKNDDNYIIVSYVKTGWMGQITTFPYLFLLVYLIGMVIFLINKPTFKVGHKKLDFRGKIQLTLILSLLGSLTVVGLGLIFYNYNEFKSSLQSDLDDKLRSVSTELSMRIGKDQRLSQLNYDLLSYQLISLSDITRTDINLYDLSGQLFATSRSEIYDRGLTSNRIDPVAYRALSIEFRTHFLHNENLGKMSFFSAYIPVYNQSNKLVGYLNIPYFTRQDEFKKEVTNFIVAFSNVYILLILISLLIALFIGNKLTLPLLKIEENLKGIQLGKINAKIEYLGEDEIGRLAKEYNKKVDELAESAALLARTERELAWREMARQVAHEINNPLTPMKLNIQYLQRIKEQGIENFGEYFDRVSKTLIENIDVLSMIASSFSDFAKMPKINNEILDLRERIKDAVALFEKTTHVTFDLNLFNDKPIQILADKDQFSRALINLIKNSIQAIPREKEGLLTIELKTEDHYALIIITDNGTGIPLELQKKLFEPSFTTKSSGMGLGLAITKRIIENFKGEIWFETTANVGTSFYIKIPLFDQNKST
jgi:two-component system, NtrC family, nitrogen regulation sensor histidine kinase NtrY